MMRTLLPLLLAAALPSLNLKAPPPPPVDTPRGSVQQFLDQGHKGDFAAAASFLEIPPELYPQRETLALHLMVALESRGGVKLQRLSADPAGDEGDNLPVTIEQMTELPLVGGGLAPVRLVKKTDDNQTRWLFTRQTVSHVEAFFEAIPAHQLLNYFPTFFFTSAPLDLMLWQWLGLPAFMVVAWLLAHLMVNLTQRLVSRITSRFKTRWDKALMQQIRSPLLVIWWVIAFWSMQPLLVLSEAAHAILGHTVKALWLFAVFWGTIRATSSLSGSLVVSPWAVTHPSSRSLLPLGSRVTKGLLFLFAVIAIVSSFGYPVTSLIAGLGIGGLAVALAAQKTMENLFGAFALGVDQPFREGDYVKTGDLQGTVETIGLRSVRIRTLDRTVVSMPNGKMADAQVENFAEKDRQRFALTLSLDYQTTAKQMRTILEEMRKALQAQPKLWPGMNVHFNAISPSSLDIDVTAWFTEMDGEAFNVIREDLMLGFIESVEKAGTRLALPARGLRWMEGGAPVTLPGGGANARVPGSPPEVGAAENGHALASEAPRRA